MAVGGDGGVDGTASAPGTDGGSGSTSGQGGTRPEGEWISFTVLDYGDTPVCQRVRTLFLPGATPAQARAQQTLREGDAVLRYEAFVSSRPYAPQLCDDAFADGGLDAVVDRVVGQLPRPDPTISGGRAITGNPSWLDLRRDGRYATNDSVDLGPLGTRAVSITARATSSRVDWGDETVTTHTGAGGPYRPGPPGPGDIVHTYVDVGEPTIRVVDTWTLTLTVAGFGSPVTVTTSLDPVELPVGVSEVRSVRD